MHSISKRRRGASFVGALAALGLLASCSGGGGEGDAGELVLYSSMTENVLDVLLDLVYEEFTGIEIEITNGSAGELTTRIAAESGSPRGDMMWGGLDVADGDKHSDIFEHWLSDYEEDLPEEYRSPNGFYNVDHLSTVAFAVNTCLAEESGVTVEGYADLREPKLKGKILLADPTSSSSAWNNLSNIFAVYGNDTAEAWDYMRDILENELVIASASSAPFESVEESEHVEGLTYVAESAALLVASQPDI